MRTRIFTLLLCLALAIPALGVTALAAGEDGWHQSAANERGWTYYRDGEQVRGWLYDGGAWYYFTQEGVPTSWPIDTGEAMRDGWAVVDGRAYYFGADSQMVTGEQVIDGESYAFAADGHLLGGWVRLYRDETNDEGYTGVDDWYYVQDGLVVRAGWAYVSGAWYWFDERGRMVSNMCREIDGTYYIFTQSGALSTGGWVYCKDESGGAGKYPPDRYWYYADTNGAACVGWQQINGKWYYFDKNGARHIGWLKYDGAWYYLWTDGMLHDQLSPAAMIDPWYDGSQGPVYRFGSDGRMASTPYTGWQYIGGFWKYYRDGLQVKADWVWDNGAWYYINAGGAMLRGTYAEVGGKRYIFTDSGALAGGGWVYLSGRGEWYYAAADGTAVTGWQTIDGGRYYFYEFGPMADRGFVSEDGVTYRVGADGRVEDEPYTGWQNIGGFWQYYRDGVQVCEDWVYTGGAWYRFTSSGSMLYGVCEEIDGVRYVFTESGALSTGGWVYCSGMGYEWLDEYRPDGHWYYAAEDGTPLTSRQILNGVSYTFSASGAWLG